MESLYLLIPLSAALVLLILAIFGWAVHRGQFEELDAEGERILRSEATPLDADQAALGARAEQSPTARHRV